MAYSPLFTPFFRSLPERGEPVVYNHDPYDVHCLRTRLVRIVKTEWGDDHEVHLIGLEDDRPIEEIDARYLGGLRGLSAPNGSEADPEEYFVQDFGWRRLKQGGTDQMAVENRRKILLRPIRMTLVVSLRFEGQPLVLKRSQYNTLKKAIKDITETDILITPRHCLLYDVVVVAPKHPVWVKEMLPLLRELVPDDFLPFVLEDALWVCVPTSRIHRFTEDLGNLERLIDLNLALWWEAGLTKIESVLARRLLDRWPLRIVREEGEDSFVIFDTWDTRLGHARDVMVSFLLRGGGGDEGKALISIDLSLYLTPMNPQEFIDKIEIVTDLALRGTTVVGRISSYQEGLELIETLMKSLHPYR